MTLTVRAVIELGSSQADSHRKAPLPVPGNRLRKEVSFASSLLFIEGTVLIFPCFSFCRKTTLTKHQRRTHKVRDLQGSCPEEYANSEQDAEGSETEVDTPRNSVPPYSQDKARTSNGVAKLTDKRTGITRRATPSSLHPSVYGMVHHGGSHGPLTPHSPLSTYSTPSSSRNSFSGPSGAFTSACDEEYYSSQQHPPTPRSPHHQMLVKQELDQQPTSELSYTSGYSTPRPLDPPTIHTTQSQDLRIACPAPTTYDLVAEAQALQHSPGSLSSCSSISTASHTSQDYFCQAPAYQPASYPSNPHTISAVDPYPVHLQQIAHYQHQVPQSHLGLGAQFQPQQQYLVPVHQHTSAPAPQVWYEVPPYQHQLMAPEPQNRQPQYYGGQELLYVKEEPVSHLMTTPQGSFCE